MLLCTRRDIGKIGEGGIVVCTRRSSFAPFNEDCNLDVGGDNKYSDLMGNKHHNGKNTSAE